MGLAGARENGNDGNTSFRIIAHEASGFRSLGHLCEGSGDRLVQPGGGRARRCQGYRLEGRQPPRGAAREAAGRILAEGEAAEALAQDSAATPRGTVRLAAPMSFALLHVAPRLPDFLARHPGLGIDLHLSDDRVDLVAGGFDLGLRIAALADSSLRARRLCTVRRSLVATPDYLDRHGRPGHPHDLAAHACLGYAYLPTPDRWRFLDADGTEAQVVPSGPLRANNADALAPALRAGLGLAVQPDFMVWEDLRDGRLERALPGWSPPPIALHLVTPPGGPRPARVTALIVFLTEALSGAPWAGQATDEGAPVPEPRP
jgi:DNA-binding transcriptional LysR family regulator